MKRLMMLLFIVVVSGFCMERTWAASGKCTVVKVDGTRMVIECNKQTKGFSKGNQIKIKSDRKKAAQNK
ncbi:MAG: hypothetical protein GY799_08520 [Desulfobulbaceae bacterium]|nr:hypothetical protein [Desulfobulbaceae bacterium]